jgi:hypothetical protein
MDLARCIYRGCRFDPTVGEGDHTVPAALGEFANLPRFRGVCPGCNNDIGKSEAQLLRCGPEAYMARIAKPPQRRGRDGKAWPGAMGAPPPGMFAERHGARLIVQPMKGDPLNREMVDCIDVIDQHGKHHPIPIFAGMSAETIRAKIEELGIEGRITVHFSVSEADGAWFDKVADELWPGADRTEFPMTEVGCYPGWGLVSFTVNDHYFRALAKMAFHYYLCHNGSGLRGDEPEFAGLRRFILEGGEPESFLTTPRESPVYFGVPFGDVVGGGVVSSARWCHLFAADDTQGTIVVYLQLFIGPGFANPPHYIALGRTPAALRAPGAWAHMLTWEPGSKTKGVVEPKGIVLGGRPETIVGPGLDTSDAANALFTAYR